MKDKREQSYSWGEKTDDGSEIWDTDPVFKNDKIVWQDWLRLLFFPKKFILYRFIRKHIKKLKKNYSQIEGGEKYVPKILDVGCGTGATVIDFKKLFGRSVDVVGLDVVQLQIDLAEEKIKEYGVWAEFQCYEGRRLPFADKSFDVIYTSDVLGHVEDVTVWLFELNRILRPGGALAMFSESELGRHAYLRNFLLKNGINTDPHAQAHVSLYPKDGLQKKITEAGFNIKKMLSTVWAKFLIHPDELYPVLQKQKKFLFLRLTNAFLTRFKKMTHPVSTAFCELYSLIEMLTVGRWIEAQGYVILAKKEKVRVKSKDEGEEETLTPVETQGAVARETGG